MGDPSQLPPAGRTPQVHPKPAMVPQKPASPSPPGPGWHGEESWSTASADDPIANVSVHGTKGKQSLEMWLNIAEPMTVGEKDVPKADARARALDVNNRELLDFATNQKTQGRGVPMQPVPPPRPPISVAQDPSALVTRRFSEITEMRAIFDEAVASIKDPASLKPTELKKRINGKVWEIIKTGASSDAAKVRAALQTIGAENVPGKGYRLRLAPTPEPPSAPTPQSPSEGSPSAEPGGKLLGRTMAAAGGAAIAGDVLVQLHEGRPVEAAKTAAISGGAMYVLGKVPALAPLAVMCSTISASKDPKIREDFLPPVTGLRRELTLSLEVSPRQVSPQVSWCSREPSG